MTPDEKAELRKAAEAALYTWPAQGALRWYTSTSLSHSIDLEDSEFIHEASPATVLALLDENARLAAEVERLENQVDELMERIGGMT